MNFRCTSIYAGLISFRHAKDRNEYENGRHAKGGQLCKAKGGQLYTANCGATGLLQKEATTYITRCLQN